MAQEGTGWTFPVGGVLFATAGSAGLAVPSIMTAGIATGIHVHDLDQINVGTLLVGLVVVVAVVTITRTVHRLRHLPPAEAGAEDAGLEIAHPPGPLSDGTAGLGAG